MSKWREEIKEYDDVGIARELWCYKKLDEYEEKIEQLENQIEMMMNCENCNGHSSLTCSGCKNYSNWHIKQGEI